MILGNVRSSKKMNIKELVATNEKGSVVFTPEVVLWLVTFNGCVWFHLSFCFGSARQSHTSALSLTTPLSGQGPMIAADSV